MTYPEPPIASDETSTLLGSLERQRATLAWKCGDLDAEARYAGVLEGEGGIMSSTHGYDREGFLSEFFPDADDRAAVEAGAEALINVNRAHRLAVDHAHDRADGPGRGAAAGERSCAERKLPA